jgi:hypothetical protein
MPGKGSSACSGISRIVGTSIGGTIVIGPKRLSTIRQELRRAIATTGIDPIDWLEARIAAAENERPAANGENEVLRSLRRFLDEKPPRKDRGKRSLRAKKQR